MTLSKTASVSRPVQGHEPARSTVTRPRLLSEERRIAADLHARKNLNYAEIAAVMGISPIRARDLCRQHVRLQGMADEHGFEWELSKRAFVALVNGMYARRMTADKSERTRRLLEIAVRYTREELLNERNVGRQTFQEIERWLADKGLALRSDERAGRE